MIALGHSERTICYQSTRVLKNEVHRGPHTHRKVYLQQNLHLEMKDVMVATDYQFDRIKTHQPGKPLRGSLQIRLIEIAERERHWAWLQHLQPQRLAQLTCEWHPPVGKSLRWNKKEKASLAPAFISLLFSPTNAMQAQAATSNPYPHAVPQRWTMLPNCEPK